MYLCFVCDEEIVDEEPHTYHGDMCPARDSINAGCTGQNGCGTDCHPGCCPTCTGRDV